MIDSYRRTIAWCDAEEARVIKTDPDYWRSILKGSKMMGIWKIRAGAQDKLDRLQLIAGLPWSSLAQEAI